MNGSEEGYWVRGQRTRRPPMGCVYVCVCGVCCCIVCVLCVWHVCVVCVFLLYGMCMVCVVCVMYVPTACSSTEMGRRSGGSQVLESLVGNQLQQTSLS